MPERIWRKETKGQGAEYRLALAIVGRSSHLNNLGDLHQIVARHLGNREVAGDAVPLRLADGRRNEAREDEVRADAQHLASSQPRGDVSGQLTEEPHQGDREGRGGSSKALDEIIGQLSQFGVRCVPKEEGARIVINRQRLADSLFYSNKYTQFSKYSLFCTV